MPRYTVSARVTVDVQITLEADSQSEAQEVFRDQIAMTASLADTPEDKYDVEEDSISEVARVSVDAE